MTQPTQAEATLSTNSTTHWTNDWHRNWAALRCKTVTRKLKLGKSYCCCCRCRGRSSTQQRQGKKNTIPTYKLTYICAYTRSNSVRHTRTLIQLKWKKKLLLCDGEAMAASPSALCTPTQACSALLNNSDFVCFLLTWVVKFFQLRHKYFILHLFPRNAFKAATSQQCSGHVKKTSIYPTIWQFKLDIYIKWQLSQIILTSKATNAYR